MTVQHASIPEAQLHESKGVSTAASKKVYVTDGLGSGSWRFMPHSSFYYDNIGTGTTYTTPVAYTLVNMTTTGDSDPKDFTHNSAGRFTYTGTTTLDCTIEASITIKHSSATLVDVFMQMFKNGVAVPGTQGAIAALSGNYTHVTSRGHLELATNDYVELYIKTASGNVVVHSLSATILGHI